MATPTVVATVLNEPAGYDNSQRRTIVQGTFIQNGVNYAAGGFTFDWQTMVDASGQAVLLPTMDANPVWVEVSQAGNSTTSTLLLVVWNYATQKFQIFVTGSAAGSPLEEMAAGGIPAVAFAFRAEFLNQD